MKTNKNKFYISIENRVYSVTKRQHQKFLKIVNDDNGWDTGLQYIEKNCKFEFELMSYFRYV